MALGILRNSHVNAWVSWDVTATFGKRTQVIYLGEILGEILSKNTYIYKSLRSVGNNTQAIPYGSFLTFNLLSTKLGLITKLFDSLITLYGKLMAITQIQNEINKLLSISPPLPVLFW